MLYKHPGKHELHGGLFDYVIVDACDVKVKLSEGWRLTTPEAKALSEAPVVKHPKVTLKQLQAELAELSE